MHYIWQEKRWPLFSWRSDALVEKLGRCNFMRGKLLGRIASLGIEQELEAQAEVMVAEVLQTAAIEGQTLNPESVRSSVARRLGLPDEDYSEPDSYTEGLLDVLIDATRNYNLPLTLPRLHSWQGALFPTEYSGLRSVSVGDFRDESAKKIIRSHNEKEKISFEAPPGSAVSREVQVFLDWWEKGQGKIDGILRAALAGFWFVTIQPYEDGNGCLARVITDMALAQDEKLAVRYYSLSAQIMEERDDYYQALETCQKAGLDITGWLEWFFGCFERAIDRSERLVGMVLLKARFWVIHRQTVLTERQRKVVNRLLDAGPGGLVGGLTNRKYVSMTKASRATSYREIKDLIDKKILVQNPGKGRSVSYDLAWPE